MRPVDTQMRHWTMNGAYGVRWTGAPNPRALSAPSWDECYHPNQWERNRKRERLLGHLTRATN